MYTDKTRFNIEHTGDLGVFTAGDVTTTKSSDSRGTLSSSVSEERSRTHNTSTINTKF